MSGLPGCSSRIGRLEILDRLGIDRRSVGGWLVGSKLVGPAMEGGARQADERQEEAGTTTDDRSRGEAGHEGIPRGELFRGEK